MLHELVSLPATFTPEALEELAIERTSVLEVLSILCAIAWLVLVAWHQCNSITAAGGE